MFACNFFFQKKFVKMTSERFPYRQSLAVL